MSRVLIIEDEVEIADLEKDYLELSGFEVEIENDGTVGLKRALTEDFDMYILDLMLPGIDGFEICKQIREEKNTPILMVSAKKDDIDKIRGLGLGADDYITKPFSLKNLYARMQAVWRRTLEPPVPVVSRVSWNHGDLVIDQDRKEVCKQGKTIAVTPVEWKLLTAFTRYPQKVFTREDLIELAFGLDFSGYDRVIDTHVKNLRKKLEDDPKQPVYICTVHGMGYKFGGFRE